MSNYYKKYEVDFDLVTLNNLVGDEQWKMNHFAEHGIRDLLLLESMISKKIKFNIKPDIINITKIGSPGVHCHLDVWPVALNIYLSGTSETNITSFWEPNQGTQLKLSAGELFNLDDLTLSDTVTIKLGDCYLLNTHTIHSVTVGSDSRNILRFCWKNTSFDTIKDSIELI